ncbi:M3 family oligoendopeptidase [Rossellomorea aquimaris]|uniref:M3 family oligoendopeptidase n=1 Tax=Rossellomorea aquimaris TaxID=189382 RepID=A0A5D4TT11_9BACI|nr:M3 family oligoendopeptidase [Rossellomorea aquimaris]TYS78169.1 M3 family oligoendopeptidase [Rossellomorea aquimaris]
MKTNYYVETESPFDFDAFQKQFEEKLNEFNATDNVFTLKRILEEINELRFEYEGTQNLITLRHVQDFNDRETSSACQEFMSRDTGYQNLVTRYYQALLLCPQKEKIEENWGKQIFRLAGLKVNSYRKEIEREIDLEVKLMEEYSTLLGTAEVEFQGEHLPLSALGKYMASPDRMIRKQAWEAKTQFFEKNGGKFDDILDKLITVRNEISLKLGRKNFVEVGYERMNRTDITPIDLENYRKQTRKYGVGFASSLRERQKSSLGVERLKYYDDKIMFKEGLPSIKVSKKQFREGMHNLLRDLSEETKIFSNALFQEGHYDFYPRKGKKGGGYATYLGKERKPFIFANLTGTSYDVRIFTHEAGHAFQFFMSSSMNCPEYIIPVDSAEIFSFAMERFAWPWLDQFFKEDTWKYKYSHMAEAFMYMPLANAVDEFEHFLYEKPQASIRERREKWRKLEKSYMPELDYDGNKYLEDGGSFHSIAHIFFSPFYFIDYDLAHTVAVQLLKMAQKDPAAAWEIYLEMCKAGGSRTLKEHCQAAGLISPFKKEAITGIIEFAEEWINGNHKLESKKKSKKT